MSGLIDLYVLDMSYDLRDDEYFFEMVIRASCDLCRDCDDRCKYKMIFSCICRDPVIFTENYRLIGQVSWDHSH